MAQVTQSRSMSRSNEGSVESDLATQFNKLVSDVEGGASRPVLTGSTAYDPPSLLDGAGVEAGFAVTGVVLGDFVLASFSAALGGVMLTAWVAGADFVQFRFQNETGGTVDLGAATVRVLVFPFASWVPGVGGTVTAKKIGNEAGVAL